MSSPVVVRKSFEARSGERQLIADVARFLREQGAGDAKLVGPDGKEITLPESLLRVLRQAADVLGQHDDAVEIVPTHKQFTTNEAADLLNVSRQYLVRLLQRGDIPFTMVGSHRRISIGDLMTYKQARDQSREAALDELAQLSQDLGLYGEA